MCTGWWWAAFPGFGWCIVGDDDWTIRNFPFPYRASPIIEKARGVEIQPRDPDAALAPGSYALIEGDYAYDFTVGEAVTDTWQCLERLAAANGTFYAECAKP